MMPEMDGIATFKALREQDATLPVLFMSGFQAEGLPLEVIQDPFVEMLNKPFRQQNLFDKLNALSRKREAVPMDSGTPVH